MRFLSIDEVTAFSMTTIAQATQEDRLLFKEWCVAAMRYIGPSNDWYKVCKLNNVDNCLKKPDDFVAACDLALYNSAGTEFDYNFNVGAGRIHLDRFVLHQNSDFRQVDVSEDAHYYYIGTNGTQIAYGLLRYFAMPVDRDGLPLIEEDNLMAYESFCRWMWAKRKNDNRSEIDQNKADWLMELGRVRGKNKMPDQLRGKEIFRKYLSMTHQPLFNTH